MKNPLKCVMLVDDNEDDNFYHERVIKKSGIAEIVVAKETAADALKYLKSKDDSNCSHPQIIFLDINMPGMNGWEFLHEYKKMDKEFQCHSIVVMLTNSDNPDDKLKAQFSKYITDFKTKPLTNGMLVEIMDKFFQ